MLHIRSSKKGVFFLENNGVPVSLLTDFNEPIQNGSLCIDTINQDLYILKTGLWLLVGSSGAGGSSSTSGIQPILETTYTQLNIEKTNTTLIPGQLYKFPFQTIHQIPTTSTLNVGTSEALIIRAISESEFGIEVYSLNYPNDIIHYDFDDILVEDGLTARSGKIVYRKDTENNLETYYDFRNVLLRRYDVSSTLNDEWVTSTAIAEDDAVIYNDDLYKCGESHTSGVSFDADKFIKLFENISNNSYLWDSTSVVLGNTVVFSDTTFNDYYTFEATCENISIGRYETNYNNIVFGSTSGASNISIGDDSFNMNILGTSLNIGSDCDNISVGNNSFDFEIGKNASNISIGDDSKNINIGSNISHLVLYNCDQVDIGSNCTNISLSNVNNSRIDNSNTNINITNNSSNIDIGMSNLDIRLGANNSNIDIASNGSNIVFGSAITEINIQNSCGNITISDNTSIVNIGLASFTIDIGTGCIDINIGADTGNIIIGNDVAKVKMDDWCDTIEIGNNTTDIILATHVTNITFGTSNQFMKLGSKCNTITFPNSISNITFEQECENIILQISSSNIYFTSGVKNKTFSSIATGVKFLISDINSKTYSNTFLNIVANMIDPNDDIWYQDIDTLGSITTVKMS